MGNTQVISTTLRKEDYKYCKEHNLKFSWVLRSFIEQHRDATSGKKELTIARLQEQQEKTKEQLELSARNLQVLFFEMRKELTPSLFASLIEKLNIK